MTVPRLTVTCRREDAVQSRTLVTGHRALSHLLWHCAAWHADEITVSMVYRHEFMRHAPCFFPFQYSGMDFTMQAHKLIQYGYFRATAVESELLVLQAYAPAQKLLSPFWHPGSEKNK